MAFWKPTVPYSSLLLHDRYGIVPVFVRFRSTLFPIYTENLESVKIWSPVLNVGFINEPAV